MGDATRGSPISPPWWYQSTCPLRRKRPFAACVKVDQSVTVRYNLVVEPGLPVSPPPRRSGFSLACVPALCDDFLMYNAGRIVMCPRRPPRPPAIPRRTPGSGYAHRGASVVAEDVRRLAYEDPSIDIFCSQSAVATSKPSPPTHTS